MNVAAGEQREADQIETAGVDVSLAERSPSSPGDATADLRTSRWRRGPTVGMGVAVVVGVVAAASLLRNGVEPAELIRFGGYWAICVLLPGTLMARRLLGQRENLVEDLAIGGLTGLVVENLVYALLRTFDLHAIAGWWWVPTVFVFGLTPSLRRYFRSKTTVRARPGWAVAMGAVGILLIIAIDIGLFRQNPLPPLAGGVYQDLWWHLAIVEELIRDGPAQVPQVAGEPFSYHVNSHVHMAVASTTSGVAPVVVLLRLWVIPMVLVTIGLTSALARRTAKIGWIGPLAAWLTFGGMSGGYLFRGLGVLSANPISLRSPSQVLAVPLVLGGGWLLVCLVRDQITRTQWAWLLGLLVVASRTKPTVLPTLLGGTLLALAFGVVVQRRLSRQIVIASVCITIIQVWSMLGSLGSGGSRVTVLGSLRSIDVYRSITNDTSLRGINSGLVLDSLTSKSGLVAASATAAWLAGSQIVRWFGLATLVRRETRLDPAAWWLAGAAVVGWLAFFVVDQSGFSQVYFLHTSAAFGVVATLWIFARSLQTVPASDARFAVVTGLGAGVGLAIVVESGSSAASRFTGYGTLDSVVFPLAVVGAGGVAGYVAWIAVGRRRYARGAGFVLLTAVILGVAIPPSIDTAVSSAVRWARPVALAADPKDPLYLSSGELEAAMWLKANTHADDVVATNSHCRPVTTELGRCNSVGFWISGLGGRRVVLEGWGYTEEAHLMHGVDGIHRNRQPPPQSMRARYDLSHEVIEAPSEENLSAIDEIYGVEWIFVVRRAGTESELLETLATQKFDNGDVAIYRLNRE